MRGIRFIGGHGIRLLLFPLHVPRAFQFPHVLHIFLSTTTTLITNHSDPVHLETFHVPPQMRGGAYMHGRKFFREAFSSVSETHWVGEENRGEQGREVVIF